MLYRLVAAIWFIFAFIWCMEIDEWGFRKSEFELLKMISMRIYGCGGGAGNNNDFRIDMNCCDARLFAISMNNKWVGAFISEIIVYGRLVLHIDKDHRTQSPYQQMHTDKMNVWPAVWNRLIKSASFFACAFVSCVEMSSSTLCAFLCMHCCIGQNACWHFPFFFVHRRRDEKKISFEMRCHCWSSSLPECNRDETSLRDTISHAAAMLFNVHCAIRKLHTIYKTTNPV